MSESTIQGFHRNSLKSFMAYNTCFQRLVDRAFQKLSEKYELKRPLCYSHNYILQTIYYQEKPLTLAEISRRSGQKLPNVSVAANALRENELIVCRQLETDKRKYSVTLSEKGKALCDEYIQECLIPINKVLWKGTTPEERDQLHRTLTQLEENARECMRQMDLAE